MNQYLEFAQFYTSKKFPCICVLIYTYNYVLYPPWPDLKPAITDFLQTTYTTLTVNLWNNAHKAQTTHKK